MKSSIRKFTFYTANILFLSIYSPILGFYLIDWKVREVGEGYIIIIGLAIQGGLFGVLQLIMDVSRKEYGGIGMFLIPPAIFGLIGLIFIFGRVQNTILLISFGLVISLYDRLFSYLLGNKYGRFNTTLVMIFSIPTIYFVANNF